MQISQLQSKRVKGKYYRNAADAVEKGKTTDKQEVSCTKRKPNRIRTIVDSLEISVYRGKSKLVSKSSGANTSSDTDHEEGVLTKRSRRATA